MSEAYVSEEAIIGLDDPGESTVEANPLEPMEWNEIESHVNQLANDAYSFATGRLARERERSIKTYLGEKFGKLAEREGRSSVVLTEVRDTIEWIKPELLGIFTQTDELGRMEPQGPEDEAQAQQRTDYANYVFNRDNPGFMNLYNAFTDALMCKVGWLKIWWDPSPNERRAEYAGLTERQALELSEAEGVEIVEATEYQGEVPAPDPMTGETVMAPATLFDVVVIHTEDDGRIRIECVPPEEVRHNRDARSVDDAIFLQHRRSVTDSELRELGYTEDQIADMPADDATTEFDEEEIARSTVDDEPSFSTDERPGAIRQRIISECYCRMDVDGDGIAEWICAVLAGDGQGKLVDHYPVDDHPFAAMCPIPIPHRIQGLSVTDIVDDLQTIKSTVMRQILDGLYLANNPRWKYLRGDKVNLDDLLKNIPGGPIGVSQMDALEPIQQRYNVAEAGLPVLDYLGTVQEKRTGVSSTYQAVDVNALDKTAFAAAQTMGRAASRILMIARIFANTGVKDAFKKIDALAMKNQKIGRTLRLRGRWVEVDPSTWEHQMDASINVGIGSGSREVMAMNLGQLANMLERIAEKVPGWVGPEQIHHLFAKLAENLGFKNAEQFLPDPAGDGFQLPPPEPSVADRKLALDAQKIELEHNRELMKIQMEYALKSDKATKDYTTDLMAMRLRQGELVEKLIEEERLREEQEAERRMNGG